MGAHGAPVLFLYVIRTILKARSHTTQHTQEPRAPEVQQGRFAGPYPRAINFTNRDGNPASIDSLDPCGGRAIAWVFRKRGQL